MDQPLKRSVIEDYMLGMPVKHIREKYDISLASIWRITLESGTPRRRYQKPRPYRQFEPEMVRLYTETYMPVKVIARRFKISQHTLWEVIKRNGAPLRAKNEGRLKGD